MPAISFPSASTADTKVPYVCGGSVSGGSTQSTGGRMRFAPDGSTKPLTRGKRKVSAATAVPSASFGTRLVGGATPLVTHSSSALNNARSAGVALCGLRGFKHGPGRGSTPGRPPCCVPAIRYPRVLLGSSASALPAGSVCTSEAPFCQYSVEELVSITNGLVASPFRIDPVCPEIGSVARIVPKGNQFSG